MKPKSSIPQYNPNKLSVSTKSYINKDKALMEGWIGEGNDVNVFACLRFVQYQYQCFSEWSKGEMKLFWEFLEKLHTTTWASIYAQSRKDKKAGFGYTEMKIGQYPDTVFKSNIDPNSTIFELRVSQEARVHGFRDKSVFYICWLDKGHNISD